MLVELVNEKGCAVQVVHDGEITATKVAQYFLTKKELTPKKLQKLVY